MGSHIQSTHVTCLVVVMRYLIKATSGREGLLGLTVAGDTAHHGWGGRSRTGGRGSQCIQSQDGAGCFC